MSETLTTCAVTPFKLGSYTSNGSAVDVFETPYDGFLAKQLDEDVEKEWQSATDDFKQRCGKYLWSENHTGDNLDNLHYCAETALKSTPTSNVFGCRSCMEIVAPIAYHDSPTAGADNATYTMPTAAKLYSVLSGGYDAFKTNYLDAKATNGAAAWSSLPVPKADNDTACIRGKVLRDVCFNPAQRNFTFNTTNSTPSAPDKVANLSTGAIVGIAVGGVVFLLLVAVAVWYFRFRGKGQPQEREQTPSTGYVDKPVANGTPGGEPAFQRPAEPSGTSYMEKYDQKQVDALLAELEG